VTRRILALLLAACGIAACRGGGTTPPGSSPAPSAPQANVTPPPARGAGAEEARVTHDVEVVKQAQEVASGILQKAGDCAALKAGLAEAQSALDDTYERARTDAAHETINNLKKQVQNAANACP
jgi:hypothetical protein